MIGDQMYSDYPPELSLLNECYFPQVAPPGRGKLQDCTPGEVRTLYQQRYRLFWNIPEWKVIQAEWPCYMIWDDHDIIDNWGSDPAHQRTPWLSVGEGAQQAYYDYQGSRVLPVPHRNAFHYSIKFGSLANFLMDIRAERRAGKNGRLFSTNKRPTSRHSSTGIGRNPLSSLFLQCRFYNSRNSSRGYSHESLHRERTSRTDGLPARTFAIGIECSVASMRINSRIHISASCC
jgi:phosphodiesterase/alkaline phosphatase D-like protein